MVTDRSKSAWKSFASLWMSSPPFPLFLSSTYECLCMCLGREHKQKAALDKISSSTP